MSGSLMDASLKMRCDTSGADYALYWKEVDGKLTVAGDYATESVPTTFTEAASVAVAVDIAGESSVAKVARERKPVFIRDLKESSETSASVAARHGFMSACFVPVEARALASPLPPPSPPGPRCTRTASVCAARKTAITPAGLMLAHWATAHGIRDGRAPRDLRPAGRRDGVRHRIESLGDVLRRGGCCHAKGRDEEGVR